MGLLKQGQKHIFLLSAYNLLTFTDFLNITPNALHFIGFSIYNRKTFTWKSTWKEASCIFQGFVLCVSNRAIYTHTHTHTHARRQDIEQRYGARSYIYKLFTLLFFYVQHMIFQERIHNTTTQYNTTRHVTTVVKEITTSVCSTHRVPHCLHTAHRA